MNKYFGIHKLLRGSSKELLRDFTFHKVVKTCSASIVTTSKKCRFFEYDVKGPYRKDDDLTIKENLTHVKTGLGMLKDEVNLWKDEMVEKFTDDPPIILPGTVNVVWKFDSPQSLENWIVTSDKDQNEGSSECSLILNRNQKALFHGVLQTALPKDGKIKGAGYCNMRSGRPRRSFKRESSYDWVDFTHLLMRVRGDGRTYLITIGSAGTFDIMWNDLYSFPLYTRGGPYWQVAKIPFSKFFLSCKGRVQDKQDPLPLHSITSFGISCGDRINGPFNLEIDYIGLQYDPSHTEKFAYEMYEIPNYIAGV